MKETLPYLPLLLMAVRSGVLDRKTGEIRWMVPVTRLLISLEILMDAAVLTGCYLTVVSRGA